MKVFATPSCNHLLASMDVLRGNVTYKQFSDGEWYVHIEDNVVYESVWVLAATPAPGDTIILLLLLLDALQRMHVASINLLLTYFGYARQDCAKKGEALSAQAIFNCLLPYNLHKTLILHIHNPHLRNFFDFQDLILLDFFMPYTEDVDIIVAPDQGAAALAYALGEKAKKEVMVMQKQRPAQEQVNFAQSFYQVNNKKILIIDDMIATGRTLMGAAELLHNNGAQKIYGAATHGLFSDNFQERIEKSPFERIFVTNSLMQKKHNHKIEVVDCAQMLAPLLL